MLEKHHELKYRINEHKSAIHWQDVTYPTAKYFHDMYQPTGMHIYTNTVCEYPWEWGGWKMPFVLVFCVFGFVMVNNDNGMTSSVLNLGVVWGNCFCLLSCGSFYNLEVIKVTSC